MKIFFLHLLTLIALLGCVPGKSDLHISMPKKGANVSSSVRTASVSSVQVINNQLVINGNGFGDVTNVKVNGNSLNENFSIESKTATKIIANSIRAFSFDVSKVFSLILSDANASATFAIDFSLCNATLNGKGFNCSAPIADKDVLSYDAVSGTWKPRAVSGLNYLGAFNASSNPATGPATQPAGAYYIISASGTIAGITFTIGDWLVSNGSAWQKIDNSTAVLSVFGRNGTVTAQTGDYDLNMLGDVSFPTAPVAGKVLKFDGTNWVAGDDLSGGGAGSVSTAEIADGAVTDAKIATLATSKLTGTISSAQITDGTIVNADINASAAIDYSKINVPDGAILYSKLNVANGSIDYAKLNIANGDIPAAKISGLPVLSSILAANITDNDTTHAPTGEAVHEALQLKLGTTGGTLSVGTISGVPTPVGPTDVVNKAYVNSEDALRLLKAGDTMTGALTLDNDLKVKSGANYVTIKGSASSTAYDLTLPANDGNVNQVLKTDGSGVLAWVDLADTSVQAFAKSALPTCAAGEVLKSNGATFSCITDNTGAGAFTGTANSAVITTAGGALGVSATTSTELGYVSGVTSAIQTQLNNKQNTLGFTPVNKAGDTISSGTFNFAGATLRADDPVAATDVVNKQYFETFGQWTKNGSDIYRSAGNVGIATSTPGMPLTVNGTSLMGAATTTYTGTSYNATIIGNTALGPHMIFDGGATSLMRMLWNTNALSFSKCASTNCSSSTSIMGLDTVNNYFTIGNGFKIGVGVTAPAHDITFRTGGARSIGFERNSSTQTDFTINAGSTSVGFTNGEGGNLILKSGISTGTGDSDIKFFTTPPGASGTADNISTQRMLISSTGNVGIGTTNPQSILDVNGSVRIAMDASACSAANAGAMRFNTPNVEFCNGATWAAFGVSNAAVASTQITDGTIVDADINAAANITATKLGTGAVDNTEFNYLNGVTSAIQTQLNAKEGTLAAGTAAQYYRGDKTWATLNTAGVPELTNLYFTQARAIASPLTGVTSAAGAITASDTIVGAFGKLLNTQNDYVSKSGNSTITGTMTVNTIVGALKVPPPVNVDDAVPKSYVDGFGQWTKNGSDIYRSGGNVGIGTTTPQKNLHVKSGIVAGEIAGFPASYSAVYDEFFNGSLLKNTAVTSTAGTPYVANGSYYMHAPTASGNARGFANVAIAFADILSGIVNTGEVTGNYVTAMRNHYAGNTDAGSLSTLVGQRLFYGNNSTVPANAPVTDSVYGLLLSPYAGSGTITNLYSLYIAPTVAGGTLTNSWGIYQADANTKNYFAGKVGVGTNSPSGHLDITANVATGYTTLSLENTAAGGTSWRFLASATGAPLGANKMCIETGGPCRFIFDNVGNMQVTGTLTQSSDVRLKRDFTLLTHSLDSLSTLRGFTYYWSDPEKSQDRQIGLIAQDVEKVFPEVVQTDQKGFKSVAYQNLVAPIIEALKEVRNWMFGVDKKLENQERAIASLKQVSLNQSEEMKKLREENQQLKKDMEEIKKALNKR